MTFRDAGCILLASGPRLQRPAPVVSRNVSGYEVAVIEVPCRIRRPPTELEPKVTHLLPTFEIEPKQPQRGSVIWMHGLGAGSHDFEPIIPELDAPYLRFVFPDAPVRPITINGGMRMPAWYDILSFDDPPLREHEPDVRQSALEIMALIEREHGRGVPRERIVLAGFSQGAAMALHVGVRAEHELAGVLVLSGYLVVPETIERERHAASQSTPFLFCHGRFDPVVPYSLGRSSYERLRGLGYPAEWSEYAMEHSMCMEEVVKVRDWLGQRFTGTVMDRGHGGQ